MKHTVVIIRSDPRISARACEAVRIALGIAACEQQVSLLFVGSSARLLTSDAEACMDGEMATGFLDGLTAFVPCFYLESTALTHCKESRYPISPLLTHEIATLLATADATIVM